MKHLLKMTILVFVAGAATAVPARGETPDGVRHELTSQVLEGSRTGLERYFGRVWRVGNPMLAADGASALESLLPQLERRFGFPALHSEVNLQGAVQVSLSTWQRATPTRRRPSRSPART